MNNVLIESSFSSNAQDIINNKNWDLCFVGGIIDDRGKKANSLLIKHCKKILNFNYSPHEENQFFINDNPSTYRKIKKYFDEHNTILIECTTLGVIEILFLLKIIKELNRVDVDLLYVEPHQYNKITNSHNERGVLNSREFNLSDNRLFRGVRGFTIDKNLWQTGDAIFLLGFEGVRLAQALEQNDLDNWTKYAVFGIPAFEPGWENNSLANNIEHIYENGFSIQYCSASCIKQTLEVIEKIHSRKNTDNPTIVVPIGTKPQSIASALFLCNNSEFSSTGILFDHPIRKQGRTIDVRKWHMHKIKFD